MLKETSWRPCIALSTRKIDEAQSDLEQRLRRDPEQFELNTLYQRLLVTKRDTAAAAAHANQFIGKLIAKRREEQAWRVYADVLAELGALEIKNPDDIVRLALQARQNKKGRLVLPLLSKFAQRFPDHRDIPLAWLLTAQILTEEMHDDSKASVILDALLKRYPKHALREQAERYAALIVQLAKSARPAPRAS